MTINYQDGAYKILGILQDIAPNGEAQNDCTNAYNEILKIATDDKEILLRMAGMLYDGLAFGNYPWTAHPN